MRKVFLIFALVCLAVTARAQTNPPAGSNLANVPATNWTNTTGTLTTTGIADTIGGTNAGRLSNSSSQGTTYVVHSLSQTVAVGDVFMAGVWTRLNSGSVGTGFPGTITISSCTATYAATGYSSTLALPTPSTTSTFQWTSVAVKVVSVSGNPCSVSFSLSSPASAAADFFAPIFFYIPVGMMQDNKILTESQNLQNYSLTCTTPATAAPPSGCVPASTISSVFGRAGAVTAQSGDYTLDLIGNPGATKTFSLAGNTPLGLTDTGAFGTSSADIFKAEVSGNGTPGNCPEQTIIGGAHVMAAITGCATMPTTITGNGFVAGLQGLAEVNASSGGQYTNPEAVGEWNACIANANNARCENADQVLSTSGHTGVLLYGREISVFNSNTTDTGSGILLNINGPSQPSGAFRAIDVELASTFGFSAGLRTEDGSLYAASGISLGVSLGAQNTSSQYSHTLVFRNRSGGGNQSTTFGGEVINGIPVVYVGASTGTGYLLSGIALPQFTVSTLPSAATYSGVAFLVTDATTFTPGTCTGGGSDTMIAVSNGTTWSCH